MIILRRHVYLDQNLWTNRLSKTSFGMLQNRISWVNVTITIMYRFCLNTTLFERNYFCGNNQRSVIYQIYMWKCCDFKTDLKTILSSLTKFCLKTNYFTGTYCAEIVGRTDKSLHFRKIGDRKEKEKKEIFGDGRYMFIITNEYHKK